MLQSLITLTLTIPAYKIIRAVTPYLNIPLIYQPYKILPHQQQSKAKYVMVVGCTDGIGKQYAKYFYQQGFYLVMVSRNMSKLNSVKQQIQANIKYNTNNFQKENQRVKLLQIDYSDQSLNLNKHNDLISSLNIEAGSIVGIVNSCGTSHVSKFEQLSWSQLQKLKRVNTNSLQLCLHTLSHQSVLSSKEKSTNNKSANPFLINLSSSTSTIPLAYSSIYSACKAYQSALISAFQKQQQQKQKNNQNRIITLSVQPWFVSTKMVGWRKGWDVVTPSQVVQGSIKVLGKRDRCAGTIKHQLLYQFRYLFNAFYFKNIGKQNYQRVLKLKQLKQKRANTKSQPKPDQTNSKSDLNK